MATPVQQYFRFYEDGTESGSVAIDTQNTNITRSVTADSNLLLRISVTESDGVSGAATDDWQLQYSLNGGTYTNITTSSSVVKAFNSSNLTDAGATTQRLSSNGLSWIAGKISEDGLVDNHQLTAFNATEYLFALTIVSADVSHNNTIDFRLLLNGSDFTSFGGTYAVTPTITVSKGSVSRKLASGVGRLVF